ncbi:Beta-mannosyltransferase 5 [Candida viswanathii]|uniref:Beta-mannosyltransferase 5 n=1 Tax=Candida viswanathii TaxID=5486 RepID=A0A367YQU2_9ASCO|nr:Beta-mannosyltransferase 5 [Candida viswanathii]
MNTKNISQLLSLTSLLLLLPLPGRLKRSQVPVVLLLLACVSILVIYSTLYLREEYLFPQYSLSGLDKVTQTGRKVVVFPKDCDLRQDQLGDYYINTLHGELLADDVIYKNKFSHRLKEVSYKPTSMSLFATSNEETCTPSPIPFEVSRPYNLNADLYKVLRKFAQEDNPYYREMWPFFPDLIRQLKTQTVQKHWYQMIGSSVWLEQYGVHFMISRIFYSKSGDKVKPVMSLSYVQIFDRDWKELENVDLIVPNDKEMGPEFKRVSYPTILPMPVYHNVGKQNGRFYGVEDPRIILVKNDKGYEEPVIIYNSHNRKISRIKSFKDLWSTVNLDMYRSMFIAWLWRSQKGKANVDEALDRSYLKETYVKVKELKLPRTSGAPRKEKNWTPFISYEQRKKNGYDAELNLIYQFQDLKIVRCSLDHRDSVCQWEYQRNEEKSPAVKRLRGGTELISINELLDKSSFNELKRFKLALARDKKQVWVGFARAALKNCGCGVKMYRPNLVVLVKDSKGYSITQISSFVDLNVPIIPWSDDFWICSGKNLLVPNGISSWGYARDKFGRLEDYLTLSLSRSDATVDLVFAKGILRQILTEAVLPPAEIKNDNNIKCAIKASKQFCQDYGKHANDEYQEQTKSLASDLLQNMNGIASAVAAAPPSPQKQQS